MTFKDLFNRVRYRHVIRREVVALYLEHREDALDMVRRLAEARNGSPEQRWFYRRVQSGLHKQIELLRDLKTHYRYLETNDLKDEYRRCEMHNRTNALINNVEIPVSVTKRIGR
ncbi:hypothetical protein [Roseibium sp. RKSG952]|uniref:hypothetical protein n=1 Tax=Roseibium sp. RKSG952 TaxID=2529384 RepID=UPI0012BC4E45|nr:hypothetical protein [Roseibium sp. RKSG952]MTH95731.1 hypothetical protein [Roseibium sp. RKSG952]